MRLLVPAVVVVDSDGGCEVPSDEDQSAEMAGSDSTRDESQARPTAHLDIARDPLMQETLNQGRGRTEPLAGPEFPARHNPGEPALPDPEAPINFDPETPAIVASVTPAIWDPESPVTQSPESPPAIQRPETRRPDFQGHLHPEIASAPASQAARAGSR